MFLDESRNLYNLIASKVYNSVESLSPHKKQFELYVHLNSRKKITELWPQTARKVVML